MTLKHNTYRLAKNLRFRIDDSGKIRAQVSQSNGEFIVSLETLALCALIERGDANLASGLKAYVQDTLQHLPQAGEIQSLIEDMAESGVLAGGQAHREDGFADDWMYFKAGAYNQNNTGADDDFAEATFYSLEVEHD